MSKVRANETGNEEHEEEHDVEESVDYFISDDSMSESNEDHRKVSRWWP